ncbi:MAG: hypothetical protein QGH69_07370, partial [Alphaproteobacteria bacterium]|nr:hypothetical protein [Alphaproteobacteria bacterium]
EISDKVFKGKNLMKPEDVFNLLGAEIYAGEWSEWPLKVLATRKNSFKLSGKEYRWNKYMADQVFKKLGQFLQEDNVTICVPSKSFDEDSCAVVDEEWKHPHFRISRDFFLIEQEIDPKYGSIDLSRRYFRIEMPKDENPMSFKKAGVKPKHDKEHMRSIFLEVSETIEGKITHENYAYHLTKFLGRADTPKSSWVGEHLSEEIKEENIKRGHA